MTNKAIIFYLLILSVILFSCTEKGFTKFKLSIYFHNQSGHDLTMFIFRNPDIDTIQIDNFENYHYGLYDYDSVLPIDLSDSILIHFEDNKLLTYLPSTDCIEKNIFCTPTHFCITADTSVCEFIIDVEEYLKAE